AGQVPEPDVEGGHGVARDAHAADAAIGAIHLVPEPPHEERILADQELRETTGIRFHGLRASPSEHQCVAEALGTGVSVNARHDQPMLGQIERDRLHGGNTERERIDTNDLHNRSPSRSRWTAKQTLPRASYTKTFDASRPNF